MPPFFNFTIALVLLVHLLDFTMAGNTTCAGNSTQWYTNAVGETACVTYQRLRQICNPNYQVPNFRPVAPGDQCDDGLTFCCCNSISWGLSMLCMNCQWDVNGPATGIDADPGSYTAYRTLGSTSGSFCTPGTNQSLSSDIQSAVCNENIKLADFLYNLYWDTGSWFYEFTMDAALKDEAATNNNMYTHCNSTTSTTSTPSSLSTSYSQGTTSAPSQTTTAASGNSTSSSNIPTIVGGVIGGVAVLVFAAAVALCWHRRNRKPGVLLDVKHPHDPEFEVVSPYTVTDSSLRNQSLYGGEYTHMSGHLPTSRNSVIAPTAAQATIVGESGHHSPEPLYTRNSSMSALRHEDAGVVQTLDRSWSGRLPPAYNNIWEVAPSEPSGVHVKPSSSPSHVV